MKLSYCYCALLLCLCHGSAHSQITPDYQNFDFAAGEKTIFEDDPPTGFQDKTNQKWILSEGAASVLDFDSQKCISIDAYYTKLQPVLFGVKSLPDSFSIEYDTWLDHGYDGNPGVEIHLQDAEEKEVVITPNKHQMSVSFPEDGRAAKDNPEAYFGEGKFYDRWVHISIAQFHNRLLVYLDQYKMIDLPDCRLRPTRIMVSGNTSQDMKILLKNFRVAAVFPHHIAFLQNKFVTHAIRFDVNKSALKPESITVIRSVYDYLVQNKTQKLEIGGHTDSDGTEASNLKLSQARAEAVKNQLVLMGIDAGRLVAKGYGQSVPLDTQNTAQAKASNRRVEFVRL